MYQVDPVGEGEVPWSRESKRNRDHSDVGNHRVGRKEQTGTEVAIHKGKDPRKLPHHRPFAWYIAETSLESKY